MDTENLYNEIRNLLPVKRGNRDFRIDLNNTLSKYSKLIESIDDDIKNEIGNWEENVVKPIDELIEVLDKSVRLYYEGLYYSAFKVLKKIIFDENKKANRDVNDGIIKFIYLKTINIGKMYFYRGRKFDDNRNRSHKDMFHVPLDMRGKIETSRYSSPGYPCLYLGSTIFACWKELEQPTFNNFMISAFQTTRDLKLFDLRFPNEEDFKINNLKNTLLSLPLIIASSFVIRDCDEKSVFKPEYIIPQLLIQIIIQKNREESEKTELENLILGIMYTSTHINNDFDFPKYVYDNVAIPALEVASSEGYCNILSECFTLTDPTCYEYEDIKSELVLEKNNSKPFKKGEEDNYKFSKIWRLEERIKKSDFHQFKYLLVFPKTINIDSEGKSSTSIKIRSNGDWVIE